MTMTVYVIHSAPHTDRDVVFGVRTSLPLAEQLMMDTIKNWPVLAREDFAITPFIVNEHEAS